MAFAIIRNLWRKGVAGTPTSEHPQFPIEDAQIDTRLQRWRTRYGVGSGNGRFVAEAAATPGSSLVVNGGFAADTSSWASFDCTIASVAGGQSGNCLEITRIGGTSQRAGQSISLEAGKTYYVSVWVKSGTSGNEQFQVRAYGPGAAYDLWLITGTTSGTWTQYYVYFTPSASGLCGLNLYKNTATAGTMLFDTVTLKEVAGNQWICFDEGGAEFVAMLTAGMYNGQTLAAEIKARLDDAGALTYTVTYSEATAKFTIAAGSNFTLRWATGTRAGADASELLGFSDAANDTGASTYTSDYRRIHYPTEKTGWTDLGAVSEFDFAVIRGHTISAAAAINVRGADDGAGTGVTSQALAFAAENIYDVLASSITKRYASIQIVDPENTAAYLQATLFALGKRFIPSRPPLAEYADGFEDLSEVDLGDSGVAYTVTRPRLRMWDLPFRGLDDSSAAQIRALIEEVGAEHGFFICFNDQDPQNNTFFVRFRESPPLPTRKHTDSWDWTAPLVEVR